MSTGSQDISRDGHNGEHFSAYLPAQKGEPSTEQVLPDAVAEQITKINPPSDPYFQHLSFEDTFGQVLDVFRERYLVFLAITFLVYTAGWMFAVIAAYTLGADLQIDGFSVSVSNVGVVDGYDENGDYYEGAPTAEVWQVFLYFLECAIYYCFICIAHGASVWLAAHLYLHQRPTMKDAFYRAAKSIWPLIGSFLLVGWLFVIPAMFVVVIVLYALPQLLLLAIVGIVLYMTWLQILFYHTYPAIMVEKLGPVDALTRSYHLTEDNRFFILGVLVCWALVRLVIGMVIASIKYAGDTNSWVWYLGNALDAGFGILFAAIESVFQAVLYLRNRVVKEKLDRVTLAADLGSDYFSGGNPAEDYVIMGPGVNDDGTGSAEMVKQSKNEGNKNDESMVDMGIMA